MANGQFLIIINHYQYLFKAVSHPKLADNIQYHRAEDIYNLWLQSWRVLVIQEIRFKSSSVKEANIERCLPSPSSKPRFQIFTFYKILQFLEGAQPLISEPQNIGRLANNSFIGCNRCLALFTSCELFSYLFLHFCVILKAIFSQLLRLHLLHDQQLTINKVIVLGLLFSACIHMTFAVIPG